LVNLGTGGSALNATFGNTTGVDTFDPAYLPYAGTNYLYLPGVGGNHASTPDTAAVSVTGDFEMVCRVGLDDWTPAANAAFFGKWGAAGDIGYLFHVSATGNLVLYTSNDGTVTSAATSSAVPPLVDGTNYWIRCTFQATAGGTHQAIFYYAADQTTEPTVWTQVGSAVNFGTAGAIFDSTTPLNIGAFNSGTAYNAAGRFYRAIIRNGIGGTTVFDADFTRGITSGAQATFTESSANAATVTINRASSGRKSVAVTRPTILFGTDDYLEGPTNNALLKFGASQDFTMVIIARLWDVSSSTYMSLIGNRDNAVVPNGVEIGVNSAAGQSTATIGVSPVAINTATRSGVAGRLDLLGGVRDSVGFRHYRNGVGADSVAGVQSDTGGSAAPFRIGARYAVPSSYADMEFIAAAIWRRALTASEIAAIVAYYGAS
jgi:hypothetical protein